MPKATGGWHTIATSGFCKGLGSAKLLGDRSHRQSNLRRRPAVSWTGAGFPYVGGKKATLRRLFREKGVVLTAEAQARFDALPESFLDFVATPELFVAQWPEEEAA